VQAWSFVLAVSFPGGGFEPPLGKRELAVRAIIALWEHCRRAPLGHGSADSYPGLPSDQVGSNACVSLQQKRNEDARQGMPLPEVRFAAVGVSTTGFWEESSEAAARKCRFRLGGCEGGGSFGWNKHGETGA
jgi:hypothetical protein